MSKLSHLNARGEAHMVDVSDKETTSRTARAEGFVAMAPETLALIQTGTAKKGDVLATARIAGIMAAKKTHELIPLCHPLAITKVTIDFVEQSDPPGVAVSAEVKVTGQTGVEMEALTAVSVACLTLYDMLKAADKGMSFEGIRLVTKTGGRSGSFEAPERTKG
jgi:cyclic pyranopterin monophosphate synthase